MLFELACNTYVCDNVFTFVAFRLLVYYYNTFIRSRIYITYCNILSKILLKRQKRNIRFYILFLHRRISVIYFIIIIFLKTYARSFSCDLQYDCVQHRMISR